MEKFSYNLDTLSYLAECQKPYTISEFHGNIENAIHSYRRKINQYKESIRRYFTVCDY